jgi:hypothetical protein
MASFYEDGCGCHNQQPTKKDFKTWHTNRGVAKRRKNSDMLKRTDFSEMNIRGLFTLSAFCSFTSSLFEISFLQYNCFLDGRR